MNFQFYLEKLQNSEVYEKFVKENPKAYLCSCLFILDREHGGKESAVHFDFWQPDEKKMFSFRVDGEIQIVPVENFETREFEKISDDSDFDLSDFEKLILEKMSEEKMNGRIQKLLFSFQKLGGKDFLVTTGFLNNLGLLKTTISVADKKIETLEKKSFFDMMKIVRKDRKEESKIF